MKLAYSAICAIVLLLAPCLSQSVPLGSAGSTETVRVEDGLLQGTVEDGLRVYRGIPYAAPPVRDLR